MDSNTDSMMQPADGPAGEPAGLARLAAAVQELASQDLSTLPDGVAAERVLALRMLLERLEGQWLKELPASTRAARPVPRSAPRTRPPPAGSGRGPA
jgi:hypothetical protein